MPLSEKHKCLFIHIPKTAGTSIEYVLGMHGENDKIGIERYFNQKPNEKILFGKNLQHLTLSEINKMMPNKTNRYFTFSFVRNPWDRLVSHFAWKDGKWASDSKLNRAEFRENLLIFYDRYKSYGDLSRTIYRSWKFKSVKLGRALTIGNRHTMPQYMNMSSSLRKPKIDIDFVGKYENLHKDWKKISQRLNIDEELEKRMKSKRENYKYYYTPDLIKKVEEIYKEDIRLFNYDY